MACAATYISHVLPEVIHILAWLTYDSTLGHIHPKSALHNVTSTRRRHERLQAGTAEPSGCACKTRLRTRLTRRTRRKGGTRCRRRIRARRQRHRLSREIRRPNLHHQHHTKLNTPTHLARGRFVGSSHVPRSRRRSSGGLFSRRRCFTRRRRCLSRRRVRRISNGLALRKHKNAQHQHQHDRPQHGNSECLPPSSFYPPSDMLTAEHSVLRNMSNSDLGLALFVVVA